MDIKILGIFLMGAITGTSTFFVVDMMFLNGTFQVSNPSTSEPLAPELVVQFFEERLEKAVEQNQALQTRIAELEAQLERAVQNEKTSSLQRLNLPEHPEFEEMSEQRPIQPMLRELNASLKVPQEQKGQSWQRLSAQARERVPENKSSFPTLL